MAHDTSVTLAAVTGAHGVTGEVRLKLFGEGVAALKRYRAFNDSALTLKKLKDDGKGGAIARFEEVTDRTAAEKLRGTVLTVPRAEMPELADGEYYHADLIGLPAVSDTGEALGRVIAVENFGAGDVLEIERAERDEKGRIQRFMVPMTEAAVPSWDAEKLVVTAAFAED
ncbi:MULTISPECIES: ribosome maturation factor RimM [Novosphingobium]|uniref:Ribosome maturation factor RimM n=1 Tax=Novosphingobium decolorationis TaxID=2698673 RepID=A0ABX8EA50_9SPHN|nr:MULTISPECIES: ribosome maturation factor RimM [Novosphingobium]QVM85912.1 16S rRNA processing protein RimM [Novosphingobium decolorationis]GAM07128.1 16S rRNA-processing protein RimM [Novosphingobium sp. MBES04]